MITFWLIYVGIAIGCLGIAFYDSTHSDGLFVWHDGKWKFNGFKGRR